MLDFNKKTVRPHGPASDNRIIKRSPSSKIKLTKENKKFLKLIGLLK